MDVASRRAAAGDVSALADLTVAARTELEPTRGGRLWALEDTRPEPAGPSLLQTIEDPAQCLFVGLIDGSILGYAGAHVQHLADGSLLAVVSEVFVDSNARGVGVGQALMSDVIHWARSMGCGGVDARVLPGNRQAKNFFERAGLVARAIVVHRALDGGQEE